MSNKTCESCHKHPVENQFGLCRECLDEQVRFSEEVIAEVIEGEQLQSAQDFLDLFNKAISSLVRSERVLSADFDPPPEGGSGKGKVHVNLFNLPEERHLQQRGLGAESHNNRFFFSVSGFGETIEEKVGKVTVELLISSGVPPQHPLRTSRFKTGTPEKMAIHLSGLINQIAVEFQPRFTHEKILVDPSF